MPYVLDPQAAHSVLGDHATGCGKQLGPAVGHVSRVSADDTGA